MSWFDAIIQLGTETAVLIYFLPGIAHIVVLGLIFQTQIETVLRSLWVVAVTLIVFGILLGIADYLGAKTL
ncbi:MAG: hypothetical protein M3N46_03205 [Actinomycetota bacterium]|nr:hypothetical protein [Actinomycetota bacterium]